MGEGVGPVHTEGSGQLIRSRRDPQGLPDESRGRVTAGSQLGDLAKVERFTTQVGTCFLQHSPETFNGHRAPPSLSGPATATDTQGAAGHPRAGPLGYWGDSMVCEQVLFPP